MKLLVKILFIISILDINNISASINNEQFQAKWITSATQTIQTENSWTCYRTTFNCNNEAQQTIAQIVAKSNYWLYINNQLVINEGQYRENPLSQQVLYNEVDLTPFLIKGKNSIAIIVWTLPNNIPSLFFQTTIDGKPLISDKQWKTHNHQAYKLTTQNANNQHSTTFEFDANKDIFNWTNTSFDDSNWKAAIELTDKLNIEKSDIPILKDNGIKDYSNDINFPFISKGDTIKCWLPYNSQLTPMFTIKSKSGEKISIQTDYSGKKIEYITREGVQQYESLDWLAGQYVYYIIPKGIEVQSLKYRETVYNSEVKGKFECNNEQYNSLWINSQQLSNLCIRNGINSCPNSNNESENIGLAFELQQFYYSLDSKTLPLIKNKILQLFNNDSKVEKTEINQPLLFFNTLAIWEYLLYSADTQSVKYIYPQLKANLITCKPNDNELLPINNPKWIENNIGNNTDIQLFINCSYSMALQSIGAIAHVLNETNDELLFKQQNEKLISNINQKFWNGNYYKSADYKLKVDAGSNAIAILFDIADSKKFNALNNIIQEPVSSSLMENFIYRALFKTANLQAFTNIISKKINQPTCTNSLLAVISQNIGGIIPSEPGYRKFNITPQIGDLQHVRCATETVNGRIYVDINISGNTLVMQLEIPNNTEAMVAIPKLSQPYAMILLENKTIYKDKAFVVTDENLNFEGEDNMYCYIRIKPGNWRFEGITK